MHPVYGAQPVPHVPVLVTRGALVADGTLMHLRDAEPRSTTGFLILCQYLWNDLGDPVFDGVGLAGFKSLTNAFLLAYLLAPFLSPAVLAVLFFHSLGWYCGPGVFGLIGC